MTPDIVISTPRLTLRLPELSDLPVLEAFLASDRARFSRPEGDAPVAALAWRAISQIAGMWALRGFGNFVFCKKGSNRAIGAAGPWHPTHVDRPELGWAIWDAKAEGKGYAFEAALASRQYAYDVLDWPGAVSFIDPENSRSVALARRLGCNVAPDASSPEASRVWHHPAPDANGAPEAYA